jgi:N6-L-threonylcarbamoyladenine synthase
VNILGIETSCDETAAAVVRDGNELLSSAVFSSMDLHAAYGGIVPEIAARSHIETIIPVIKEALSQSSLDWPQIDGIAVTYGAGLSGSLLVGVETAKTLAITKKKPLWAVNHVEGHVYANFITKTHLPDYTVMPAQPSFPMLALIVSGGHSQLVLFEDHFKYKLLGQTLDDAIGEAFDKVAKILGLAYPGGPSVAVAAKAGNISTYKLPKAHLSNKYDFSFSGLKTAVLRTAQSVIGEDYNYPSYKIAKRLSKKQVADLAASFEHVAIETAVDKTTTAVREFKPKSIVIAGGVAASADLRTQLELRLGKIDYPDIKLCTDNGAMIAALGCFKAKLAQPTADPYALGVEPNLSM